MRDKRCHSGDSTGHGIHALGLAHGSDPNAGWWPGKSIMRRDMMRTNTGSIRLTRGNSEVPDAILTMMGPIAQRSEPPAHNRSVPGSNPGGPTKLFSVTELHFVLKPKAPLKRGFFISQ